MKYLVLCILLLGSQAATADGERAYQYRPDGSRDWSAGYYERKGDIWIPYRSGGSRDWRSNTVKIEKGNAVQYLPGGSRDWNAPVISITKK